MKEGGPIKSNNAFVKGEQAKMAGRMGDRPGAPPEMEEFDAYMSNDGANAKQFARKLCAGMDDAFPLK